MNAYTITYKVKDEFKTAVVLASSEPEAHAKFHQEYGFTTIYKCVKHE